VDSLKQFQDKQYVCIESFRKSGQGVRTPVGFVVEGQYLFILTSEASAKAKRIRNNPRVNIAPSTPRGDPLGTWVEASATLLDEADSRRIREAILAKYPVMWRLFEFVLKKRSRRKDQGAFKQIAIRIALTSQPPEPSS
jgi:PPOX class probable F420-dependent enzyme